MNHLKLENLSAPDNLTHLGKVIECFNGAALRFETYYHHLERRVRELNTEVKLKNEMLERNLIEKEEMKSYLNSILESLNIGVIVVDLRGNITTSNRAAETITGLPASKVKGKKFDKIFGRSLFHAYPLALKRLKSLRDCAELETEIYRGDSSTVHVALSLAPLKSPQGKRTGVVVAMQDISQVKRLEERANRTDRLAAMGEMAGKIAHEVRNPLGSIELFACILRKELEDRNELKSLADHISAGTKSINNIISNMLLFIRPQQKPKFQAFDIREPLNDSLFFSSYLIKSSDSIAVNTQYPPKPLMVLGDLELMKQMFLNLILNAIQAMCQGGALQISIKPVTGLPKFSRAVEIRIADSGVGIGGCILPRVFDPFFTTKERGTGLGLSIVHNILVMHGGIIDIDSVEGKGTVCVVTLPLYEIKRTKKSTLTK